MRSIRETGQIIKSQSHALGGAVLGEWGLFILVILAITGAFGLGRLSVLEAPKGAILVQNTALAASAGVPGDLAVGGMYEGSKTGDIYYFPWCSGATKIAPEDRRWFADEKAAQKAGYHPAGNCKGMDQ